MNLRAFTFRFLASRINLIKGFYQLFFFGFCFCLLFSLTSADIISDLNTNGESLSQSGDYDEALAVFETALNLDDTSIASWLGKGDVLLNMGQYSDAYTAYEKAISIEPRNYSAYIGKGLALDYQQKYDKALLAYEEAIKIDPNNILGLQGKGDTLKNLKNYEEAIKAYDLVIEIDPKQYETLANIGNTLQRLGKFEDAIKAYDKALKIEPNGSRIWERKGDALQGLERYAEAIIAYDEAIEISPEKVSFWYSKGVALKNLEKYEESIKAFDTANDIDPNVSWSWANKGEVLQNLNKHEEAINAFDEAINLDPNESEFWFQRGNSLKELKKFEDALSAYNKAIDLDPEMTEAQNNRELILNNVSIINTSVTPASPLVIVSENLENKSITQSASNLPEEKNWWDGLLSLILLKKPDSTSQLQEKKNESQLPDFSPLTIYSRTNSILIGDESSNSVIRYNLNGTIDLIIRENDSGLPYFKEVSDVTEDDFGNIYVLDAPSLNILKFDRAGRYLNSWEVNGIEDGISIQPKGMSFLSQPHSNGTILLIHSGNSNLSLFDTEGLNLGKIHLKNNLDANEISSITSYSLNESHSILSYKNISPSDKAYPPQAERNFEVKCSDEIFTVKLVLDRGKYLGAQDNSIIDININSENPEKWLPIIEGELNDPVTRETINVTGEELDKIYHENQLTDSEYFDLITGFIQQIPLVDGTNMRYPIEVISDKKGTSQDKALFLYSLLQKAGYDVRFISYPGTTHCAVGVRTDRRGNPQIVTSYPEGDKTYLYINPDKPEFVGRISSSVGISDPFLFKLFPPGGTFNKILPQSSYRIYIIETLYRIQEKSNYIEENIYKLEPILRTQPEEDVEKINSVSDFVESQPWNTEGDYMRLKNSKVENIEVNYELKDEIWEYTHITPE